MGERRTRSDKGQKRDGYAVTPAVRRQRRRARAAQLEKEGKRPETGQPATTYEGVVALMRQGISHPPVIAKRLRVSRSWASRLMKRARKSGDVVEAGKGEAPVAAGQLPEIDVEILEALEAGDDQALQRIQHTGLGQLYVYFTEELERLRRETATNEKPVVDDEGGVVEKIVRENPRAKVVLKLAEILGITADQQVATPKSRGEKSAQDVIKDYLTFLRSGHQYRPTE